MCNVYDVILQMQTVIRFKVVCSLCESDRRAIKKKGYESLLTRETIQHYT